MDIKIIAIYAGLLGLWLSLLSARVIALRGSPVLFFLSFGKEDSNRLAKAIRGHANLTEYAPLFLILLLIGSALGVSSFYLHLYGSLFCVGRLIHGTLFCFFVKPSMLLRVGGMLFTLLPFTLLSCHVLMLSII